MNRRDELRADALKGLREHEVLMLDGHFDYGNGYHGGVYLNPHRIFRHPSLVWRLSQDLIEILPEPTVASTEVVAGPVMGGALLAHTIAGLLDGRLTLRPFHRTVVEGSRVLPADDVRNTGETFARAKAAVEEAGGTVIATAEICDRLEAVVDVGVPNAALAEYRAPENHPVGNCPLCQAGQAVTKF